MGRYIGHTLIGMYIGITT